MSIAVASSTAQTPAVPNFASLKRFVLDYLQQLDSPRNLDAAGRGINAALDRINMRVWNWSITYETLTLVADDADYAVDAAVKKPRKLLRLNSSSERDGWYHFKPPKTFLDEHPSATTSGTPTVYTVRRDPTAGWVVLFDVPPASGHVTTYPTARFHYYARVQHFTDDGDNLGDLNVPPEVWAYLGWQARHDMASAHAVSPTAIREASSQAAFLFRQLERDDRNEYTDWEI
jgi:hypothetical protein